MAKVKNYLFTTNIVVVITFEKPIKSVLLHQKFQGKEMEVF